jgi:hypothetical protein
MDRRHEEIFHQRGYTNTIITSKDCSAGQQWLMPIILIIGRL